MPYFQREDSGYTVRADKDPMSDGFIFTLSLGGNQEYVMSFASLEALHRLLGEFIDDFSYHADDATP